MTAVAAQGPSFYLTARRPPAWAGGCWLAGRRTIPVFGCPNHRPRLCSRHSRILTADWCAQGTFWGRAGRARIVC